MNTENHYALGVEYDTGKKWVDGKTPIFRKTVDFGALPNAGAKTVAHGLTAGTASGNIDLSKMGAVVELHASDPDATPALSTGLHNANITTARIIGDNISITTDANLSAFTQSYVVIEYCKVA